MVSQSASPKELYRFWQGKQLYFFHGKLQFGINLYQPACTFVLINLLEIILMVNTVKDLVTKGSGYKAWLVFGVLLQVATSVLLVLTATKDPATIPMRDFLYSAYQNKKDRSSEE